MSSKINRSIHRKCCLGQECFNYFFGNSRFVCCSNGNFPIRGNSRGTPNSRSISDSADYA